MSIWDHDLWADIYKIEDTETRVTVIRLYKLVLDMHNKDILSEQIAHALKGERKIYFTIGQKLGGLFLGILLATDTIIHLINLH